MPYNPTPSWVWAGLAQVVSFLESYGWGVVAALIVLACSRKQVERFVKTLQERALTASGPSEDRLRDQVRQARERQQREAERVQAEFQEAEREGRAAAAETRNAELDAKAAQYGMKGVKPPGDGRRLGRGDEADEDANKGKGAEPKQPPKPPASSRGFDALSGSGAGGSGFRPSRPRPRGGGGG